MTTDKAIDAQISEAPPRVSGWRRFRRVFFSRPLVVLGFIIILGFIITAIFAPLLAPYDPYEPHTRDSLSQPSKQYLLGSDAIGRDVLSRIIYGTRISLLIGVVTVCIGAGVGMAIGLVAGYFGGWVNLVIMRLIDTLMAFPMIVLALSIASLLGPGLKNIIIALSVSALPGYSRTMNGLVLSAREIDYVVAGRAIGAGNLRIMLRHIVPNCFPPLIVMMTFSMGMIILAEAALSYLGIGITPPTAAWGAMVNYGYKYLLSNPMLSIAPGVCIMLLVFAFNMVGDGLRDALDPRLRGVI